jgi:hypothetical protein
MLKVMPDSKEEGPHHITHAAGIRGSVRLPARGYLRFAVIRDPRDLIATRIALDQNKSERRRERGIVEDFPSKGELVEKYVTTYCAQRLFFIHDYVDVKIRYEQLEPQLHSLLENLGVDPLPKLRRNRMDATEGKKPWWHCFTKEQTERIYEEIPEVEQFR